MAYLEAGVELLQIAMVFEGHLLFKTANCCFRSQKAIRISTRVTNQLMNSLQKQVVRVFGVFTNLSTHLEELWREYDTGTTIA